MRHIAHRSTLILTPGLMLDRVILGVNNAALLIKEALSLGYSPMILNYSHRCITFSRYLNSVLQPGME